MPTACIAVIDDDEPTRELMREVLTDACYRVALWSGIGDPVGFVEHAQPDLVILDLWLGKGYHAEAVIAALCGDASTVAAPVIVCSADANALDRDQAGYAQRGCVTLKKPFDLDDLVMMVGQQLTQDATAY